VIPELANDLGATLTVLGTAARTGLSKLLIGNTAEDMIGRIRGDVVTVREPWS
jgi:nucleotide-binding universal stress UspA family protein